MLSIVVFWIDQGVRIFRVDNPHTKPFAFWEWLIGELKRDHPDVILLSEAFTRPKVMYRLAKSGFSQSYTYFAWRNTSWELSQYFTELRSSPIREFLRPNLSPNTPDILTEYLQSGGRPAFAARLVLAATLGASYGIYGPAFELGENRAKEPGSEEYLDSEKYQIRSWDRDSPSSLRELISVVNKVRRENPALHSDNGLVFHPTENDQIVAYTKSTDDLADVVLTVVNVDPHHRQIGMVTLPLEALDSDGDGSGDFRGLIDKLPYLQDLGVSAVWLLPFYPSPMRDDGYDISDYTDVNPMYGNLTDAHQFIKEAHRRGIRVINELVCNHTSDQHPWFQRARRSRPGSAAREFYVWSDTNQRYQDARIIFKDFEVSNWTWDHVAGAYYWQRFYSHQPDLNFDNPKVKESVLKAMDFWLDGGIDGMRLDAIPYLFEREGTTGENLTEAHAFLKEMRRHVDEHYPNRMLLSEANQWPEDAVAYFGQGDETHMAFHFPLMPRLFMSIRMEDRFPIVDILAQTPAIPDTSQWALFLRNHDELTLEMVTDEERDYMYRAYTQDRAARINLGIRRRLAPLLGNDRSRIELMHGLLLSLPGTA